MRSSYTCQQMVPGKLSSHQKYRINLLLFFLVFFPFLNIFGHMDRVFPSFEAASLPKAFNYGAVLGFGVALLWQKYKFSQQLLVMATILLGMLIINYLLTPLASMKWLFNWLGFIFVSLMLAQIVKSLTGAEMQSLQVKSLILVKFLLIAFITLVSFAWLTNISDFAFYASSGSYNQVVAILSNIIGIEKQAFGTFLVLLVIMAFTSWTVLSKSRRVLFVITFLIICPAMLGVRTVWLSLALCAAWVFFVKYPSRRVFACVAILLNALFIYIFYQTEVMAFISYNYDRLPSLKFAWSTMMAYPFGLGNGGHHVFVEANGIELAAQFGSERMVAQRGFWVAPESDLVFFIGSWGILSVIFFAFFGFMLLRGGRIFYRQIGLLPIEGVMLLMTGNMIFMGTSQDNAGHLIWWVYMAAGFGVILRYRGTGQKGSQGRQDFQHRTSQRHSG